MMAGLHERFRTLEADRVEPRVVLEVERESKGHFVKLKVRSVVSAARDFVAPQLKRKELRN